MLLCQARSAGPARLAGPGQYQVVFHVILQSYAVFEAIVRFGGHTIIKEYAPIRPIARFLTLLGVVCDDTCFVMRNVPFLQ